MNDMFLEDKEMSLMAIIIGIVTFDWFDIEFIFTHLPYNMGNMYCACKAVKNMFDFIFSPNMIANAYSEMLYQNLLAPLHNILMSYGFILCLSFYGFIGIVKLLKRIKYDNRLIEWGVNFAIGHVMIMYLNFACNYIILLAIFINGETYYNNLLLHDIINNCW